MAGTQARRGTGRRTAAVIAGLLLLSAGPFVLTRLVQRDASFPTLAAARDAGGVREGWIPPHVPPGATEIRVRRPPGSERLWLRFRYPQAARDRMTAGLARLDTTAVRKLEVPTPGWASWWPVSSRTLSSSLGRVLAVYEAPDAAGRPGYLALDHRTLSAFYWRR